MNMLSEFPCYSFFDGEIRHSVNVRRRYPGRKATTWEQSILETKCLAEQNNGFYIPVETEDDLIAAFEKTLGCPVLSQSTLR
jgi:hypothetical protein